MPQLLSLRSTASRRLGLAVVAAGTLFAGAPAAHAATANATQDVNSGTLTFIDGTPGDVTFQPLTLSGVNQNSTPAVPQGIHVQDARGGPDGWKIDLQPTVFTHSTDSSKTLPAAGLSLPTAPAAAACLAGSTCTPPTNSVAYPLIVNAAPSAPTTIYQAAPGTGRGEMGIDLSWQLRVPASTVAGTYTSTWLYTLSTAP